MTVDSGSETCNKCGILDELFKHLRKLYHDMAKVPRPYFTSKTRRRGPILMAIIGKD